MDRQTDARATMAISWDSIHRDSLALAERLKPLGPFIGAIAVARGGLVPAALIAHHLGLRLVDTVCIASYAERIQGRATILKAVAEKDEGAGWLVIDDLVDTGITARKIREMIPRAHIAALYAKPMGRNDVDSCLIDVDQDVWLVFPWEMNPVRPNGAA